MKIKKEYTYSSGRQIWRLLPSGKNKLVIEERDPESKQVYFNCIELDSGDAVFSDFQLEEKFWIGIEKVTEDKIIFHMYEDPQMPVHKGIICFDIFSREILWENPDLTYLFMKEENIFSYKKKFEGREFYSIYTSTGEVTPLPEEDIQEINRMEDESSNWNSYIFAEPFHDPDPDERVNSFMENYKTEHVITGRIEYAKAGDNLLLMNSFEVNKEGLLDNIFRGIDLNSGIIIFEEILNNGTRLFSPDSFFIMDKYIFLLKEKTNLVVCSI